MRDSFSKVFVMSSTELQDRKVNSRLLQGGQMLLGVTIILVEFFMFLGFY